MQARPSPPPAFDLEAARAGDPQARAALLRHLLPRIRATLARYVGTGPDLDDLTQEALVDVLRGLPGYRGEAPIEAWVTRIAQRRAWSRRRPAAEVLPFDGERHGVVAGWEGRGAADDLVAAVEALPPPRRTVLMMHDVEGYSAREVGEILGVPLGTVSDRLREARHQLRRALRWWRER